MREVSKAQRVPRIHTGEHYRGACEFCLWEGTEYQLGELGRADADQQSREHLGSAHPEKVAYWEESQTSDWWENLTPEQNGRLGELIDSRVRNLGETYATAERRAKYDIGPQNKKWILG